MQNRIRGNEYRTTIVCVDSYENGILAGRFYNPYLKGGETFQSLTQFLIKMEQTLDMMNLPQSFTAVRAFASPPSRTSATPPTPELLEGTLATFAVRILFRQNASWQGSITWLEGGMEQGFRSVLELVLLMDSALSGIKKDSKNGASLLHPAEA
ncbi:MAG: hypothetical protein VB071_13765 [Lawsonibacter sp.]|nr:hypothetical protein [Lawsonibacter sp.]